MPNQKDHDDSEELEDQPEEEAGSVDLKPNEGVDPEDLKSNDENNESEAMDESRPAEHTLDDLAGEPGPDGDLPTGVNPQRPRSFNMMEEDQSTESRIPSSGLYERGSLNERSSFLNNDRGRRSGSKLRTAVLLLIVLLVLGGTVYLLKGRFSKLVSNSSPTPTPTEQPSFSPIPSPSPTLDRTKYKIRVLNGTSTSGLATSLSAKLKDLGYQIDKTGNATNSSFTATLVSVKDGTNGLVDILIKDLSSYSTSTGPKLTTSDSADGEVIIGSK